MGAFAPPEHMGPFTMGGTRYDAAVSMGYSLVAPTPGSHRGFMPRDFSSIMVGPQGGMFTGAMPREFNAMAGQAMREMGPMMPMRDMGQMPMRNMGMMGPMMGPDGMTMGMPDGGMPPAWLMGPGAGGSMDGSFMVFDPAQGGWHRDDGMSGMAPEEDYEQESAEEGDAQTAAPDAATTQEDAASATANDTTVTTTTSN